MIRDKLVQIELSPVNPVLANEFGIDTVAGRDGIAEQLYKDINEYCAKYYDDGPRSHLGVSQIGHNCARFLWYQFRWMFLEYANGRQQRLWARGHREEDFIISYLRGIGIEVQQVDVDGQQLRVAKSVSGHYGGSADSRAKLPARYGLNLPPVLLEFKTSNEKWFKPIYNMGVIKASPKYWIQCCTYGRKLGLHYVLFICVSKNDDELDVELLELDWGLAEEMERKAEYVIRSTQAPQRLSNNASYYECRWCPALSICHFSAVPQRNCRSCKYSVPIDNGQWGCNNYQQVIPKDFIPKGCGSWTPIV